MTVQTGEDRDDRHLPEATVQRLAGYLRVLNSWPGVGTICSDDLAAAAGVKPAQLRRDLSYLGNTGTRGVGYDLELLTHRVSSTLGAHRSHRVGLVGVGNLGRALVGYSGFRGRGFQLAALFDVDPAKVGRYVGDLLIESAEDLVAVCAERRISIGVIATPREAAQGVADVLVAAGVLSILNFAPAILEVPADVEIRRVDLGLELQMLAFHEARRAEGKPRTSNRGSRS